MESFILFLESRRLPVCCYNMYFYDCPSEAISVLGKSHQGIKHNEPSRVDLGTIRVGPVAQSKAFVSFCLHSVADKLISCLTHAKIFYECTNFFLLSNKTKQSPCKLKPKTNSPKRFSRAGTAFGERLLFYFYFY